MQTLAERLERAHESPPYPTEPDQPADRHRHPARRDQDPIHANTAITDRGNHCDPDSPPQS